VLSHRTILVCAGVVVVLAVASGWLLLALYGGGSGQDRARVEVIRTVGTIVLGGGGAIALLLAARRQQTAEHDLAEKRRDLALKERDATARQITDLYTKAVEQLGADKAPVRLGGLYALERVAQDHPLQRQTIVNVVCAYLRMPFTPPNADGEITDEYCAQIQECEVRITMQQVLTSHLRPGDGASDTFWDNIDLDLKGATLIDFVLAGCQVRTGRFREATFHGAAWFDCTTFTGDAWFRRATFTSDGSFKGVKFSRTASFEDVTFAAKASFRKACFADEVTFTNAIFAGAREFDGASFARGRPFD
jgi:hypothetical protein